ncbi:MAG: Hsp70 family protein [Gammaproteobacteria bacterium]
MNSNPSRYLIGIDLGTTHTVVAYADLQDGAGLAKPQLFEIEQLIAPGEVARRPLLPSFRYHPAPGELPDEQLVLPWRPEPLPGDHIPHVVGELARELGSKVEGRQIASAKSWLSHDKVDRSAAILPWAAAEDVEKASPVVASAAYLNHVRCAWNHEHPDHPLEQQTVVITVPASFDEAARALTLEAAEMAGYPAVDLLEEPQAVCYDWFHRHRETAASQLAQTRLLFVVDVGGGTTDLSLIRIDSRDGNLRLDRIAVGDHLMLGGDNVDLALAHQAEARIHTDGKKLSAASLSQLIQQSRKAKELLLGDAAPESAKVTLLGSGSRLIGGARSAEFSRGEVQDLALDGFFPLIPFGEQPAKRSSAVVAFGLPYAPDPAVSRYLSQFLLQHQQSCRQALGIDDGVAIPDAVLFNGGVFRSHALKQRALTLLTQWRGAPVTELPNAHPDLAVAYGAVSYLLARATSGLKIGGGSARSYFLQVHTGKGEHQGVCLLPKGTEPGTEIGLTEHRFSLRLNQPVQFHLTACSADDAFTAGELVALEDERFLPLPPLVAALDADDTRAEVPVTLVTRLTEVGTLDLQCASVDDPNRRWKVEFQLRRQLQSLHSRTAGLPSRFKDAVAAIDEVFGPGDKAADPNAVKRLRQQLEKLLGERDSWDTPLARALFDVLWERSKRRRRSQAHERVWFNLAGYCVRPGFGAPADDWRISQILTLYPQGLQFNKESQSWAEWWIFWRRVAGGLDNLIQQRIYKDISKFINPATARNLKVQQELKNRGYEDMVRLVGALENLDLATKTELGGWLLKRLEKSSETLTCWWALGRLGAREPFHGSAHNVLPPKQVEPWLAQIMRQDWRKNPSAAFAAVMLARVCDDRERDLSAEQRGRIAAQLQNAKCPELWQRMVTERVALDEDESKRVFGETLPAGIKLIT